MKEIIEQIKAERIRQDNKFGVTSHDSVNPTIPRKFRNKFYGICSEEEARERCEGNHLHKSITWSHIFIEEVAEVVNSKDERDRREELIQVAAVCIAWLEDIDRKKESK